MSKEKGEEKFRERGERMEVVKKKINDREGRVEEERKR